MEVLIVMLAILAIIFTLISVIWGNLNVTYHTGNTGKGVLNWYKYHSNKLLQVKFGCKNPWTGWQCGWFEILVTKYFSLIWSLIPLFMLIGLGFLIKFIFSLLGIMIFGIIALSCIVILSLSKLNRMYLNFVVNGSNFTTKLAKFCSNVNKVVNKVKESE